MVNVTRRVQREANLIRRCILQRLYLTSKADELEGGQDSSFRHEAMTNLLLGVILGPDELPIAYL